METQKRSHVWGLAFGTGASLIEVKFIIPIIKVEYPHDMCLLVKHINIAHLSQVHILSRIELIYELHQTPSLAISLRGSAISRYCNE